MVKAGLFASCASVLVAVSGAAHAAALRDFDIPAQPLNTALAKFGLQSGMAILFEPRSVEGRYAPAVIGQYDPAQALDRLLAGAPLRVQTTPRGYILAPVVEATSFAAQPAVESAPANAPVVAEQPPAPVSEEIVVTGSRTIRNGNASPSPVTVVQTADLLQISPGTLSDALGDLPVFAGSRNTSANPTVNGSQTGGNSNSNNLNLRNLGTVRTLVLMDGYRVPPTSFNNAVDVDIIPQMLVQRVDVVTGGVSAVYGSDAVAGVVNYVLDKHFNGIRAEADYGVSQLGDDRRYDLGVAVGKTLFDGRTHFEASYQRIDEAGVLARSSRSWINDWGVTGSGTTANPYVLQSNVHQSGFTFGGLITGANSASNPLGGMTFDQNGVLSPFVNGVATGTSALQIGGDGATYNSTLIAPERAHQIFARVDQEITPNIQAYAQVSADLKRNEVFADSIKLSNDVFSSTNAFLPAAYQAQLAAAKQTSFKLSELMGDFSRYHAIADSRQWTYMFGLDGSLGGYKWGLNYDHGTAQINTQIENNPNAQRLAAALDAVVNPATGQTVCNASLTNSAYSNCVPLNVFGPTAQSAAALAYVAPTTYYTGNTALDDVAGHIDGSPLSDWAGPVNVSLSGEWRKLTFNATTTASALAVVDCTGLRFNCAAGTGLWGFSFANEPTVSQTVQEVAFEANVPLIKDVPFIKEMSINGAARYTSYNTSGSYWTWKIGADWHVDDKLRFRATQSRDIRAPTLYELYAPVNSVPVSPVDLLTGLSTSAPSTDLSNANLKAEIADTTTAGFVWSPLPRLTFTVDAYRIAINQAVVDIAASASSLQNACYASGGTSFWCTLQTRALGNYTNTSPANVVTHWYTQYLNIGEIETYGADFEGNYATTLFGRPAAVRAMAAYQPHNLYKVPGSPTIDQGGAAFGPTGYAPGAVWRLAGFLHMQPVDHLSVDLLERYRNDMKLGGDPTQVWVNNHIPSFATTNLTLTWTDKAALGQSQLFFNISNLFDAHSPGGAYSGNGTRAGLRDGFVPGDDVVGRAFTIGLKLRG